MLFDEQGEEEENQPKDIEDVRNKLKEMKAQNNNNDELPQQVEIHKKEEIPPKEEIHKKEEKEEITEEEDFIKIMMANSKKDKMVLPEGNKFQKLKCYFKKIKIPKAQKDLFSPEILNNFNEKNGIFFCKKMNEITNEKCEPGKLICQDCMKNTQKMFGLKAHYLINSCGRICTFRKNKIYCLGKFSRIEEENNNNRNAIKYSINYVCGHTGQCESCKNLTEKMEKYFGASLMKQLKDREKRNHIKNY